MARRLQLLICGSLLFWAVAAYPAFRLWGNSALVYSAVAMTLCLLPAAGTLAWSTWASNGTPEQQLLMVLGSTAARMAFVLGAGMAVYGLANYFRQESFWLWVLVFYLYTLALEMALVVSARSATGGQTRQADPVAGS